MIPGDDVNRTAPARLSAWCGGLKNPHRSTASPHGELFHLDLCLGVEERTRFTRVVDRAIILFLNCLGLSISKVECTRCTSMKCGFFPKKHVKFGRIIKSALFKVCSIVCYTFFSFLGQFVNITLVKIFSFCCEPFIKPFFSHLRTNRSAAQQVRDQSMQTSGNRKEPSLLSNPHEVELLGWVLPTCREPVLPYVMEHCHEE